MFDYACALESYDNYRYMFLSLDSDIPLEGRSDPQEEPYESVKLSVVLQRVSLMLYRTGQVLVCHSLVPRLFCEKKKPGRRAWERG